MFVFSVLGSLWQRNKRFLFVSGAGLAVFLLLNSAVSSYALRADRLLERASQLGEEARRLKQDLEGNYWEVQGRLEDYARQQKILVEELSLPPESALGGLETAALLVQFNEATEAVWGDALELANRRGVELPERLSAEQDFGYEASDGADEFRRYYHYLAITRRGLEALLAAGMTEIGRPELIPEDVQPIRDNAADVAMMLRVVRFSAVGPYDAFSRLLQSVQTSGNFLQVQVLSLSPSKTDDDELLRGELLMGSLRLVEAESVARPAAGGARPERGEGRRGTSRQ